MRFVRVHLKKWGVPYPLGTDFLNKCLQTEQQMTSPLASLAVVSEVSGMLSLYKDLRLWTPEKNVTPTQVFIVLGFLPPGLLLFIFYRN